jgi:regulator of cell morphogenesis and NO signaling
MDLLEKRITQIIEFDYRFGALLHRWGIDFYKYPDMLLAEVCRRKHINGQVLIGQITEAMATKLTTSIESFTHRPIADLIDYLRQAHRIFTRYRLPYMAQLIRDARLEYLHSSEYIDLLNDLKIAFPLFAEDFIGHILEEEQQVFNYITLLDDSLHRKVAYSRAYYAMEKYSIEKISEHHHADDDDMAGIRELTHHYAVHGQTPLLLRVLFLELQAFEEELKRHATFENDLLLPKAARLEARVRKVIARTIPLN